MSSSHDAKNTPDPTRAARPIRVGIAGQGRSGYSIHARCLKELTGRYDIAAVADLLPERRADGREQLGAEAFGDYREMLDAGGFDLFVNALPSPLHVPGTVEAIERGFHVVCEKPMAATVDDFDRMVDAARGNDRLLAPFQNNRLQPFFDKMLEVIDSGVLGRIIHIRSVWGGFRRRWDWQTLQRNMGGTLFNTGPHAIDQALLLFGRECEPEVFCRLDCNHRLGGDADDLCSLTLYDPQRRAPTIEIHITSYLAYPREYTYTVCGTLGTMEAGASEVRWRCYDPDDAPEQEFWTEWSVDREYPREELPWTEDLWRADAEEFDRAVGYTLRSLPSGAKRFYLNVSDVLAGEADLLITTDEVRRQIAVLEQCARQNPLPTKDGAAQRANVD